MTKAKEWKQDFKEAVKWVPENCRSERCNRIATPSLGFMYEKGQGVEQDFKEAVKWYQKAADQGFANAAIRPWGDV